MKKAFFITIMSALLICSCQRERRCVQLQHTFERMGARKLAIHSFYGP